MSRNVCENMSKIAESNSTRFLAAYNIIDKKLRRRFRFGSRESFSEMIRKIAGQSFVVRKYEDSLIEYARLRNAIVHGGTDTPIAEPHDSVVQKIENMCKHISSPPAALSKIARRKVDTVSGEATVKDAMFLLAQKNHSHLPVLSDGEVKGIVNGKILISAISEAMRENCLEEFISTTKVKHLCKEGQQRLYEILPRGATIEDAAALFDKNNKLKLILISDGGLPAKILGVVTVADIVDFNNILSE